MGCAASNGVFKIQRINYIDRKIIEKMFLETVIQNQKITDPLQSILALEYMQNGTIQSKKVITIDQLQDLKSLQQSLVKLLKARPDNLRNYKKTIKDYVYYLETIMHYPSQQCPIPELKMIIKEIKYPFLLYKQAINYLIQFPEKVEEVTNPQSQHIKKMNDVIKLLNDQQNNFSTIKQPIIPSFILDTLKSLKDYYQQELNSFIDKILQQAPSDIQKFAQQLSNEGICEIRAPLLGNYLINNSDFEEIFNKDNEQLKQNQISIQRVAYEDILFYQRYLIIYILNKFMFQTNILPSIVVRTRQMKGNMTKPQKLRTNFLVSLLLPANITSFNIDQFEVSKDNKDIIYQNKNIKIKQDNFMNHLFTSLITIHLEYYIPDYIVTEEGDMYRIMKVELEEKRQKYAGIKTPLLFFKKYLMECALSERQLLSTLMDNKIDYDQLFLKGLKIIELAQLTDFRDSSKAYSSYLSQNQLFQIKDLVHRFNLMYAWLIETIFPFSDQVFLSQLIDKQQHILIEISMRNMSKNANEYIQSMKQVSIEAFLQKTVTHKILQQFLDCAKYFDNDKVAQWLLDDQTINQDICQWVIEQNETKKKKESKKERTYLSQVTIQKAIPQIQQASFMKEILPIVVEKSDLNQDDLPLVLHLGGCYQLSKEIWQKLFSVVEGGDQSQCTKLKLKEFESISQSYLFERDAIKSDKRKKLVKSNLNRKFGIVNHKGLDLVFEENPRWAGLEIATQMFFVQISPESYKMDKVLGQINGVNYLISVNRPGCRTLVSLLGQKNQDIEKQLDADSLSDRILTNILIYPGKEGPEDVLLIPDPLKKNINRLEFIGDASRCFALSNYKVSKDGPCQLGVKSILFCTDFMNKPISTKIFDKFSNLYPSDELQKYYEEIIALSVKLYYIKHTTQQFQTDLFKIETDEQQQKNSCLGIPYMYTQTRLLYQRFYRIYQFLNFKKSAKGSLTHQELLEFVDPQLGQIYRIVNTQTDIPLQKRYDFIEDNLQNIDNGFLQSNIPTFLENFNMDFTERAEHMKLLQQFVDQGQQIGATHCLSKLHKYSNIVPEDQSNLNQIQASIQLVRSNDKLKYFSSQLILHNLGQKEQEVYFKQIFVKFISETMLAQNKESAQSLILMNMFYVNSKLLLQLDTSLRTITTLVLFGTNIQQDDVETIAEHCPCLGYLDLSYSVKLNQFNKGKNIFLQSQPVEFSSLKTLILNNAPKLTLIDVQSNHLMNLSVNQCPNLQLAFTRCRKLYRISALDCTNLKEENIIVWIIAGIEVALNQKTSKGYFKDMLVQQKQGVSEYERQVLQLFGKIFVKIAEANSFFQKTGTGVFSTCELIKFIKRQDINFGINRVEETRKELVRYLVLNPNIRTFRFSDICSFSKDGAKDLGAILKTIIEIIDQEKNGNDGRLQDNLVEKMDFTNMKFQVQEEHYRYAIQIIANLKNLSGAKGIELVPQEKISLKEMKAITEYIQAHNPPLTLLNLSKIALSENGLNNELNNLLKIDNQHLQITRLYLNDCKLNDSSLESLCEGFKQNRTVKVLDLSSNNFTAVGFNSFLTSVQENRFLHTLNASQNNLKNIDFPLIKCVRNLTLLDTQLTEQDLTKLGGFLGNKSKDSKCPFITLDISKNQISLLAAKAISSGLQNNTDLREFIFNQTFAMDNDKLEKIKLFVQSIQNNKSLSIIEIGSNQVQDDGLIELSKVFTINQTLKGIRITDDSTITKKGVEEFVKNLNGNVQLSNIILQDFKQSEIEDLARKINPQLNLNLLESDTKRRSKIDHCILGMAIDGGGMRGIIPATIIEYFCDKCKLEPHEIFNVIGGTSIGGILTLGITSQRPDGQPGPILDRRSLVKMLLDEGPKIFSASKLMGLINNLRDKAKYSGEGIEGVLSNYFQNLKLSDTLPGVSAIVTAVKREMKQGDSIAKVFKSTEAMFDQEKNFLMRDVARATSAAPSFFPSAEITNLLGRKYSLIDGGVGQNNPAKFVLEELEKNAMNEGDPKNFFLISLGTGMPRTDKQLAKNAGIANLLNILESFGESCSDYVDYEIKENHGGCYFRVQTNLDMSRGEAVLDDCSEGLLKKYQDAAKKEAIIQFSETAKYGKYKDRTMVDYFTENTAKKKDFYI